MCIGCAICLMCGLDSRLRPKLHESLSLEKCDERFRRIACRRRRRQRKTSSGRKSAREMPTIMPAIWPLLSCLLEDWLVGDSEAIGGGDGLLVAAAEVGWFGVAVTDGDRVAVSSVVGGSFVGWTRGSVLLGTIMVATIVG